MKHFRTLFASLLFLMAGMPAYACTSAIIGAEANPYGRPLLWKHRDTSKPDNKVEYVASRPGEYSYVALFDAKDKLLREAWTGMNSVGFAIMNTASYNLKDDKVAQSKMDREGYVMQRALRKCRTVDDFEKLLRTLPRPMGVEANFGVIDATGAGAYFETNNHSFKRYDLKDAPDHVLIRTNYSYSGRPDEGFGFNREANAKHLLEPYIKTKSVTPEVLTEIVSRSFYHNLLGRDCVAEGDEWAVDQDFIPRASSTATIVVEGPKPIADASTIRPGDLADECIMWTGLGYPPVAEIVPVYCKPDGVAEGLRGTLPDGHSVIGDKARKQQADVFSIKKGNGEKYVNIGKLYNKEGSGYTQTVIKKNLSVYEEARKRRDAAGRR